MGELRSLRIERRLQHPPHTIGHHAMALLAEMNAVECCVAGGKNGEETAARNQFDSVASGEVAFGFGCTRDEREVTAVRTSRPDDRDS